MKTMNNFAAQQLSKKQMNEVQGGYKFMCYANNGQQMLLQVMYIETAQAWVNANGGGMCFER